MIRFSELMLLLVIAMKPAMDALYAVPIAKYVYMLALIWTGFLAYSGRSYSSESKSAAGRLSDGDSSLHILFWTLTYAAILYLPATRYGTSLHEIFKILSPFILYLLVRGNVTAHLRYAILTLALAVIFVNAALLPFDFGWAHWGSVRTFKGFYYFKTDLAYSVITSLLLIGIFVDFRIGPLFAIAIRVGAVEVVLSNARLNYLLFVLFLAFLFWRNGVSFARLAGSAALVLTVSVLGMLFYDSATYLSPLDFTDMNRFTQGREKIWDVLVNEGLLKASWADVFFGQGMYFDWDIINEYGYGFRLTFDAHNELIHLLLTQGMLGLSLYICLYVCLTRDTLRRAKVSGTLSVAFFALTLLALQGLTSIVSSYASKTWPVVLVLLMLQSMQKASETSVVTMTRRQDDTGLTHSAGAAA